MKKFVSVLLVLSIVVSLVLTGCGENDKSGTGTSNDTASTQAKQPGQPEKPATWIADRHIVGRAFDSDVGLALPNDQINNEVAKKIRELTGITFEWQYTAAEDETQAFMTALAAGDLPDFIFYYMNNGNHKWLPIVLKAARENMFADIAPFMKETNIYKKYFEKDYLPSDTYNNIVFRPEFNGAVYIVHMNIPRTKTSEDRKWRGGMFIQKSIADALNLNGWEIKTHEDLYNLCKKIKDGNFKDKNGNPVTPLGPSIWGGNLRDYTIKDCTFYYTFDLVNGKFKHEIETDLAMKQVDFMQKMLKEGLMHPEIFTMDNTRAEEACKTNSFAIIEDIHNYMDLHEKEAYLPVGPIIAWDGSDKEYKTGKTGYDAWSIPKTTKNPQEVVKFLDFMASKEGKLLTQYGIEGKHYDMKDGKPYVKKEIMDLIEKDRNAAIQENVYMGGQGSYWSWPFQTDMDSEADFGELIYGTTLNPKKFEIPMALYNYGRDKRVREVEYVEGFSPMAFLNEFTGQEKLKPVLSEDVYKDIRIKAFFAKTKDAAQKILDDYKNQLEKAGLKEFEEFLDKKYQENPKQIRLR